MKTFKNSYLKFWACEQTWTIANYLKSKMQFHITKLKNLEYCNQVNPIRALPLNLSHLTFGFAFNQVIGIGVLPQNLSHLTFGFTFNQVIPIEVLPPHLSHLNFGYCFEQIVPPKYCK